MPMSLIYLKIWASVMFLMLRTSPCTLVTLTIQMPHPLFSIHEHPARERP
ncbi:hypothetical protein RchiOBHm_Chr4g0405321 [Rosa chinensis]|uniref:Uncharacterized protein n=1 Tax=Rosa chinensis TaxID=74649 RepID=A0A2P6QU15_ROSCH|nr:hypothetical protein RchiOBHm_Chr4g0405321 [Rosa chinensis]